MPTSINASKSTIERSKIARYGNRYYPVDESYDKRVYENSALNWFKIIIVLILFWVFQAVHWWGVFELGVNMTDVLMWYSIAVFAYTIVVGGCMLLSGKYANKKKRHHDFLQDKIAEKKALRLEDELRDKQAAEYAERVAQAAAKEGEKQNYAINDPIGDTRN